MPRYDVELSDGSLVEIESDHEPNEQEILSSVGGGATTPAPPTPMAWEQDQRQAKRAEIERQLGYPRDLPRATTATGFGEEVQERFGEYAKGLTGLVPSAMKVASVFAPSALDYITGGQRALFMPPVQLEAPEQQPLYKAGEAVSRELESIWPSPEVPDIGHGVMQGFGQMGPMLGVGAGARAAGLGMKGALAATTGLGAIQEFDDAYGRARQRGDEPDEAFAKSLGYATVAMDRHSKALPRHVRHLDKFGLQNPKSYRWQQRLSLSRLVAQFEWPCHLDEVLEVLPVFQ